MIRNVPFAYADTDSATALDNGLVLTVDATDNDQALAAGVYKIAAMGTPLLWSVGTAVITNAEGSYLAAGDQELIVIPNGGDTLHFIRSADATVDGQINIVQVQIAPGKG